MYNWNIITNIILTENTKENQSDYVIFALIWLQGNIDQKNNNANTTVYIKKNDEEKSDSSSNL